ncbi:MAG: glycerophosphoryl diester phosphodiesterase membrane domain-containing protein, partial [Microbacterium sp.]
PQYGAPAPAAQPGFPQSYPAQPYPAQQYPAQQSGLAAGQPSVAFPPPPPPRTSPVTPAPAGGTDPVEPGWTAPGDGTA